MILTFKITDSGIEKATKATGNWIVLQKAIKDELTEIVEKYELPNNIFTSGDDAEEITHYEEMDNSCLGELTIISLMNLSDNRELAIEKRLKPMILIFSQEITLTFIGDDFDFLTSFLKHSARKVTNKEQLCTHIINQTYAHFLKELKTIKKIIDDLDVAARTTTENEELFRLADTRRDVVYLDHTLRGQKKALNYLWEETDFAQKLGDDNLAYNVRLRQAHTEERIMIYRDLLETVGGLFSDMMSNHLNHLMKYLDSAALVISIPALIAGIWGMNTGGLPGREPKMGFLFVMILAVVASLLTAIYLKRKDFTK